MQLITDTWRTYKSYSYRIITMNNAQICLGNSEIHKEPEAAMLKSPQPQKLHSGPRNNSLCRFEFANTPGLLGRLIPPQILIVTRSRPYFDQQQRITSRGWLDTCRAVPKLFSSFLASTVSTKTPHSP